MSSKSPEIRFNGFTDDWEQRKLDLIFKKIRNAFVGTATPYYVEDGNFYLESNNVKDGSINRKTEIFINNDFYEKQKDKWLHTDDIVMVQSGHVGHTAVIPEELNNTAAHAVIMFQGYQQQTDPHFLNFQFQTGKAKKELSSITTGNTIKHILASEMKKFKVSVPQYEEQNKVGDFFKELDNAIALHQRELDNLIKSKKGFLQKMFPKKGKDFPEVRFSKYTKAWDEKKLGNYLKIPVKKVVKIDTINDLITLKLNLGGMYSGTNRETLKLGSTNYYERNSGQFLYGKQNFFNGSMGIIPQSLDKKATSGDVPALDIKDINTDYLFTFVSRQSYWKSKEAMASGTGSKRIHEKTLQAFEIQVPSMEEQNQIGKFFKKIDEDIELKHKQLNNLKQIKKAFLQKMFV